MDVSGGRNLREPEGGVRENVLKHPCVECRGSLWTLCCRSRTKSRLSQHAAPGTLTTAQVFAMSQRCWDQAHRATLRCRHLNAI